MSTIKSNKFSPQSLPIVQIDGFNDVESFVVGASQTTFTSANFDNRTPLRAFKKDIDDQWIEITVVFTTSTDFEIFEGVVDGDEFVVFYQGGYYQNEESVLDTDVEITSANSELSTFEFLNQMLDEIGASAFLESYKDYGIGSTSLTILSEAESEDVNLETGIYLLNNVTDGTQGPLLTINYQGNVKQNYYPYGQNSIFTRDNTDGGTFGSFVEISGGGSSTNRPTIDLGASYELSASDLGAILYSTQGTTLTIPNVPTTTIDTGFYCEVVELLGQIDIVAQNSSQLVSLEGDTVKSIGSGSNIQIKRVTDTQWVVSGDILELIITAWDLTAISYDGVTFSTSNEDASTREVSFKDDGTKMYVLGAGTDIVFQYTLSTPWDLSTASYDSVSFGVGDQAPIPNGIFFKPDDGTKMYIICSNTDSVYQYTLATPWDLSTASYDSVSFSVATEETNPQAVFFKSDGTKMYVAGTQADSVIQYTLATPWDLSTASYDSVSFGVVTEESVPTGIFLKPDGTKLYVVGSDGDAVFQYSISTPWDLSTASYDSVSFGVGTEEGSSAGLFFKPDGMKLFIIGATGNIYQYS